MNRLEALGEAIVAYGRDLRDAEVLPAHTHRRAQLVYASRGVMTVTTDSAAYVVPPQRAVWVPGGVRHGIEARSAVDMRTLYIEPTAATHLPSIVRVLQVTPLLRELILAAVESGQRPAPDGSRQRLMAVILDQIGAQPDAALSLPMPSDPRLRRVTDALMTDPGDSRDLGEWAEAVGASKRTLGRLFAAQTGMSFRDWRQQRRLLRALELLGAGEKVTLVALELGYENASAFIAMFKRCLGTTPGRYSDAG